jgi:NAD(P)-dependent dehydrogenase (short-subunit alcohol dehydrogenase family)
MVSVESIDELIEKLNVIIDDLNKKDQVALNKITESQLKKLDPRLGKLRFHLRKKILVEDTKKKKYQSCYICKTRLWKDDMYHEFYECMCKLCGEINYARRDVKKDLSDKVAIVTGGRVKIGFETSIRLLRNGCTVVVTSRFVDDCLLRYQECKDYCEFKDRLTIYQLNMLSGKNISKFVQYVTEKFKRIDYLINNAAQTIRRPKQFYQHVIDMAETNVDNEDHKLIVHRDDTELLFLEAPQTILLGYDKEIVKNLFPNGKVDVFGQQIDLRESNSWSLEIDQIDLKELAEVYIINSIAPYILCSQLKPLLKKRKRMFSYIINVTSMEGVFNWQNKPTRHPHTNMAKAALNMLTRTCGEYYIKDNIRMVCIDTGWNNSQYPNSYETLTPVDCIDGAARILDPIYRNLKKVGIMYKDYQECEW